MVIESIPALAHLSSDEQLILAAELWRGNTQGDEGSPDPQIVTLLRERKFRYETDPKNVKSWDEVKAQLRQK